LPATITKVAFFGEWGDIERHVGRLAVVPLRDADVVCVSSWSVLLDPPERLLASLIFIVGLALPVVTKHAWLRAKADVARLGRQDVVAHVAWNKKTVVSFSTAAATQLRTSLKAFQAIARRNKHISVSVSAVRPRGCPEPNWFETAQHVRDWVLTHRRVTNYMGRRLVSSENGRRLASGVEY
jgi:hypothetical protein